MTRRAPSIKSLAAAFPMLERRNLQKIRACIHQGRGLEAIDRWLENHGVEAVYDRNGHCVATYSNSGDTYAPTILLYRKTMSYRLTTLGDFVETYERRFAPLP